jgi:hypothetical protein
MLEALDVYLDSATLPPQAVFLKLPTNLIGIWSVIEKQKL